MRTLCLEVIALITVAVLPAEEAYRFLRSGDEPYQTSFLTLAEGQSHPTAGDLFWVGYGWNVLGPPGIYRIDRVDGIQHLSRPDGPLWISQAIISDKPDDPQALTALSREERAHLGIVVIKDVQPDEASLHALADCDVGNTVLEVEVGFDLMESGLSGLPLGWRYVSVRQSSGGGGKVLPLDWLKGMADLHWLSLDLMGGTLPSGFGADHPELVRLDLDGVDPGPTDTLAGLGKLRWLSIRGSLASTCELGGLASLLRLEELDLSFCQVAGLEALDGHPSLRTLALRSVGAARLPTRLPVLKDATLMDTGLAPEPLAAFAAAHGEARVITGRNAALRDLIPRVDRLVLRTGGTCHRDQARERVLLEEKDPAGIRAILGLIEVKEQSGGHCMCCGSVVIEVYASDEILSMIGMHHGIGLRSGSLWPGDSELTESSSIRLCEWMATVGAPGPKAEFEEGQRQRKAWQRRRDAYVALIGAEATDAFLTTGRGFPSDSGKQAQEAFVRWHERYEAEERVRLALRLYGTGVGDWSRSTAVDGVIEEGRLADITEEQLVALLPASIQDPVGLDGLTRWCFGAGKLATLSPDCRAFLGPVVARHGLGNPRAENRQTVVEALVNDGGAWVVKLLEEALQGIAPRPDTTGDEDGATLITARPRQWQAPEAGDVVLWAAAGLAQLGQVASLPAIREAAGRVPEAERPAFLEVISALESAGNQMP